MDNHRFRLSIVAVSALAFLVFAIRSHPGEPPSLRDLLFVIAVYGVPFLVFVYIVWSSRWSEIATETSKASWRNRIALAADVIGGASAGLFLLLLPFWSVVVVHTLLGELWVLTGVLTSEVAIACAIVGSRKLRRPAFAAALLLPFWFLVAALLVKASMD